ncbi:MAG: P-loop containing nucleoside triphosphate hydrolase protein [Olpidium bornovanus]|uniref:P-loop containing nucleoside triphosphate hydrolase protein n=1 Tax=Olpidium bornovanus TaxID=278681 RepID=A0A8H7ZR42_9FUNG|nr:MAG: P-loop containing nucleoside triphosphate hydrolase protein [Olpidium bornovanus]
MEAFGNAKTSRNDNSSRFGKYIEIEFDENQTIVGAKIRTYLLERTRLISQPESERNYHIFYQLVAGAPPSEKEELGLMGSAADFHYLNQGGADFQSIKGVDDAAEFAITQRALSTIGVAVQLQWQVFRLLSALLHVGNIKVGGSDKSPAFISESDVALETSARLLGLDAAALQKWLTMKQIITRSDKIVSGLSTAQAVTVRDALAKFVYSCVFEWLVEIVNSRLRVDKVSEAKKTFIGVLDIYGFEHFEKNSFEQFCINYANEKLQQGFAEHVFKLEQEEYVREQIEWTFIDFADNQRTIDMIEGKLGILSLLDEECRLPSGSDAGYLAKLYQNFETAAPKKTKTDGSSQDRQIFSKPRFSNSAFTIQHYAHPVTYEAEGFVEKNKDSVPEELLEILKGSQLGFLKDIIARREQQVVFAGILCAADDAGNGFSDARPQARLVARRPTLGSTFKTSLISLMNTIHTTNVHYIRCIKPNTTKQPWEFDAPMVLSQLRACGVLETIRISCAGYPSRWTISEFVGRFYMLVHSSIWARPEVLSDVRVFCKRILSAAFSAQTRDKYQIGVSRIFFRAGQVGSKPGRLLRRFLFSSLRGPFMTGRVFGASTQIYP